jgi:ankyrin repeat protein
LNLRILKTILLVVCLFVFTSSIALAGAMDDMLLNAVANNNLELAKTAVTNGADVNYAKKDHYTPLTLAVKNKNAVMVSYLLNSGADTNQKMDRFSYLDTPLIFAVENDDLKIAQMLVQAGADVNTPREMKKGGLLSFPTNADGATPLIFAIQKEMTDMPSLPMVQFLISKGADVNQANDHGYTPLMASAEYKWGKQQQNRCQIAKVLLQAGADPVRQNDKGKTALQYAIDTNFVDMINLLLPISPK